MPRLSAACCAIILAGCTTLPGRDYPRPPPAPLSNPPNPKLFVADGTIALIGGRNIGDQYFQIDPESQFADDDVFATGPVVEELAASFEEFWNSDLAIPAQALLPAKATGAAAAEALAQRTTAPQKAATAGLNYQEKLAAAEPLASVLGGQSALAWAPAEVACDSPDKGRQAPGSRVSDLLFEPVAQQIEATQSELILVSPYLVPTDGELRLLQERRAEQRSVRILTNSLEATTDVRAQAGYMHYRVPLLESGVQLYEIRARPQSQRGTGRSAKMSQHGNFALHAKLLVFDRSGVFVGSMNYDQRSARLNTENGLIIHSAELAEQTARRFAAMTQPQNAYAVTLQPDAPGDRAHLEWDTAEAGHPLSLHSEPARSSWQKFEVQFLELLPLDREL